VAGDTIHESDDGFTFTLSNPSGAVISTVVASGLIVNDDASTTSNSARAETSPPPEGYSLSFAEMDMSR
jgi:hypothetical protein